MMHIAQFRIMNPHQDNIAARFCTLFNYAPNFEKVGSILLSACPSMRPSMRASGLTKRHLLSILGINVGTSVCPSVQK